MKKLIGFIIVAGLLGGYIYLFDNSLLDFKKQEEEQSQLLYDTFKVQHPHHILIKNGEETVDLMRPWKGKWTVVNADNYPADEAIIAKMIEAVLTIKKDQIASTNPQNWDKFDVTSDKGIEVIIKEREDREIAHFWVGKMGPSYQNQYFRKNNLDEVYLVDQNLSVYFTRPLNAWKDRTILSLKQEGIYAVKVALPSLRKNFDLVRSGSGWTINDDEVAQEKVHVIIGALSDLKTNDFPDEEVQVNVDTADYIVTVESEEGVKNIYIRKMEEAEDYYVILEGNPTLFIIPSVKKREIIPGWFEIENIEEPVVVE